MTCSKPTCGGEVHPPRSVVEEPRTGQGMYRSVLVLYSIQYVAVNSKAHGQCMVYVELSIN